MKIVIIDNYDSFTYNLSHLLKELGAEVTVVRNDKFELGDLDKYDKILLSPGPGIPSKAGKLLDVIEYYKGIKPILGVCLGEQAIGEVFGAKLKNLDNVFHGIQSIVEIDNEDYLFRGLPNRIKVGRYHSWVVDGIDEFPDCLRITSKSDDGCVMAICHREFDIRGIQFHPESVLTEDGKKIIRNWLENQ